MSGLAALNAMRDGGEPRYVPSAIADKFCGHVLASAVAMALYRRERTGRGHAESSQQQGRDAGHVSNVRVWMGRGTGRGTPTDSPLTRPWSR